MWIVWLLMYGFIGLGVLAVGVGVGYYFEAKGEALKIAARQKKEE